jgi:FkbM family methyltransferase
MIGLRDTAGYAKRAVRVLRRQDLWPARQMRCRTLWIGNSGARWCICPDRLSAASVVYSFGVGTDISFDLGLIARFGLPLHAFDPTPQSIDWLKNQDLPREFRFHPYGVAGFDGTCAFLPPENREHISYSMVQRLSARQAIEAPVRRLGTIMEIFGHERLDLLKMDIEGAEYAVLADMLANRIVVQQLLVEFHHRWPQIGIEKTKRAIRALNAAGYRIFSVSPSGEEYSFLFTS